MKKNGFLILLLFAQLTKLPFRRVARGENILYFQVLDKFGKIDKYVLDNNLNSNVVGRKKHYTEKQQRHLIKCYIYPTIYQLQHQTEWK